MRLRSTCSPALVGLVFVWSGTVAAQTINPCVGKKLTCVAALASALDHCYAVAAKKGATLDGACTQKARDKFSAGKGCIAKAERKGGCLTTADAAALTTAVEAFVADLVAALDPDFPTLLKNKCTGGKHGCVAAKVKALFQCHVKAAKKGTLDPLCTQKATAKFDGGPKPPKACFTKLERKNACVTTGDLAGLEALADDFVRTAVCALDAAAPGCAFATTPTPPAGATPTGPPGTLGGAPTPSPTPSSSGVLPPDPATVASPVDAGVVTTIDAATAFLYSGANPIQTGVAPGTFEAKRTAVVRGRVSDANDVPLSAVTIRILDHPEFGQTLTRADGMFDLVVNGGGPLVVDYRKTGRLPAQRQVDVPVQDYVIAPNVMLIALDPQVTMVDLAGGPAMQPARGSVMTDADGTRQATLLFPAGTSAAMVMPDGSTSPMTTLHVRATEYTVGPNGPSMMPGGLPPASGYTYAVELSADEAIAAGATSVQFNQPVPFYVENFVGFPVGSLVPVGFYDRARGQWVAADNGQVIAIVAITGGKADLDLDGDGLVDDAAALAALAITDVERQRLASLYPAGRQLWRVLVPHFTPFDLNWPYGPPDDSDPPGGGDCTSDSSCPDPDPNPDPIPDPGPGPDPGPNPDDPPKNPCEQGGSIIACQTQRLGETLGIAGTPFSLNYRSDGAPQTQNLLKIKLSANTIPASVQRIDLTVSVAGQQFTQSFAPSPNLVYTFHWDGKDAYGRTLQGSQPVRVRLGYVYNAQYYSTRASLDASYNRFGAPPNALPAGQNALARAGGVLFVRTPARGAASIVLAREYDAKIGGRDARGEGLGAWTLDVHHSYDPVDRVLHLGNGRVRSAEVLGATLQAITPGSPSVAGIATAANGDVYFSDSTTLSVYRVGADGTKTRIAGTGSSNGTFQDGVLATSSVLYGPQSLVFGPDGSLFILTAGDYRVRRVAPNGIISTVLGTGNYCPSGSCGDGGPGTAASFAIASALAAGPDGSLYLADWGGKRVRRIGPDGIITAFAGNGTSNGFACTGEGGFATTAQLPNPQAIAVGPDGTLYVADFNCGRIFRVGLDGILSLVAGGGSSAAPLDGTPAKAVTVYTNQLAVGRDGTLYFAYQNGPEGGRIYRIDTDGLVSTVAGSAPSCPIPGPACGLGGPATAARIHFVTALAVDHAGVVSYADYQLTPNLFRVAPSLPSFDGSPIAIPALDGESIYAFTGTGRHARTVDALTGAVQFSFSYDGSSRLTGITDVAGNVTTIERNGAGTATAIVAPDGQRTALTIDADGYLTQVTDPLGGAVHLTYDTGASHGLLATLTDERNKLHHFSYDANGRLTRDEDPAGGFSMLTRTEVKDDYAVAISTAENVGTNYKIENLLNRTERMTVTAAGVQYQVVTATDGTRTATSPDGTLLVLVRGTDPRFGTQVPLVSSRKVTTPGGRVRTVTLSRSATLTDPTDPLSLTTLVDSLAVNGHTWVRAYDGTLRRFTTTGPTGRHFQSVLDTSGRTTQVTVAGLAPADFTYDARGRLASVAQDGRSIALTYGADGFVASVQNALGTEVGFARDATGRVTNVTRADGSAVALGRDASGNITSVTPPTRPAHLFTYTDVGLLASDTPPDLGPGNEATNYQYDFDGRLTSIARPDATLSLTYDAFGHIDGLTFPGDTIDAAYDAAGRLATLATGAGVGLAYQYDGPLVTELKWTGDVAGRTNRTYDNDLRVSTRTVNGGNAVSLGYDDDGALIHAGALTIHRDAANGLITGTTLGDVADSIGRNGHGEAVAYTASFAGANGFELDYDRDAIGRVHTLTEKIGATTRSFGYGYDTLGRLQTVTLGGATISTYTYDAVGNRLSGLGAGGPYTYDAQDRLLTRGSTSYTYTAGGDLATKTTGAQTTTYVHDVLGRLRSVTKPSGTTIAYVIDGRGRRIGKRVDGTLVQGFLYQDGRRPIAELDGANAVVSTFVYGSRDSVPDYLVKGGTTYRILTDQLGSPRLVVRTSDGAVEQRIDYDELGRVVLDTQPGFQPFGFAGGLYDQDTGLVRFGARDYDPETGRWTSKDARGLAGGIDLYAYANDDPVNFIDASGRTPAAGAVAGALGTAAGGGATLGLGATSAFVATALILGVPTAIGILATAAVIDSAISPGEQAGDDEGEKEGGAPPQEGENDGGTCPLTPVVPQGDTDKAPPPDEAIPDDFLINPTFPKRGPEPRIPYPETPENGFDDPSLDAPFRL